MQIPRLPIILIYLLFAFTACGRRQKQESVSLQAPLGKSAPVRAYPLARWRLDTSRLSETMLWVSHIVIRHRDVSSTDPCFNVADWHTNDKVPSRTRAQALALAEDVAKKAAEAPEKFPELARLYSDDLTSRSSGGSLGGLPASHLEPWPEVLDALAAIGSGRTSKVVETRYGFHVFYLRSPVTEQVVSGVHLVIAYDNAQWIQVLARGPVPQRSRPAALALATELVERARKDPGQFPNLVQEYSEHRDAVRGGDMGTWSTRELTDYPREVEALAQLEIGAISEPIDSAVGFQVMMRVVNRRRPRYAMEQLRLDFDPSAPSGSPRSKTSALAAANLLAADLSDRPLRFAEFQHKHCCSGTEEWLDGRGSPAVTNALDGVRPGEIVLQPVASEFSYVIARRLEAPERAPTEPLYELPKPATPNVVRKISTWGGEAIDAQFDLIEKKAQAALNLDSKKESDLVRLHRLGDKFGAALSLDSKKAMFDNVLNQVHELLGDAQYSIYVGIMNTHFEDLIFAGR